jgi:hypothetical protein
MLTGVQFDARLTPEQEEFCQEILQACRERGNDQAAAAGSRS